MLSKVTLSGNGKTLLSHERVMNEDWYSVEEDPTGGDRKRMERGT